MSFAALALLVIPPDRPASFELVDAVRSAFLNQANYNHSIMALLSRPVPVFPLPDCVVLPGGEQALHIFEPRYRRMVTDELARPATDRFIAMALLKPGYEPHYYTHHAPSHSTVCLCRILKCEALPDGRFNILVLGVCRASVEKELQEADYRLALLGQQSTINNLSSDEERDLRSRLARMLQSLPAELLHASCRILEQGEDLEGIVDQISFHLLGPETAPGKQMILQEPQLDLRVKMLVTLLERVHLRPGSASAASLRRPCRDRN